MKALNEWMVKPILFILLLPVFILISCLGFFTCWQCHETTHLFKSKKYHLLSFGTEVVCKDCYELLTRK
jgi:uncharacterized CHY-type Zn-finger protein